MVNAGIGERKVNNLLAAMNIPGISPTALKQREREFAKEVNAYSEQSCARALEEEKTM